MSSPLKTGLKTARRLPEKFKFISFCSCSWLASKPVAKALHPFISFLLTFAHNFNILNMKKLVLTAGNIQGPFGI